MHNEFCFIYFCICLCSILVLILHCIVSSQIPVILNTEIDRSPMWNITKITSLQAAGYSILNLSNPRSQSWKPNKAVHTTILFQFMTTKKLTNEMCFIVFCLVSIFGCQKLFKVLCGNRYQYKPLSHLCTIYQLLKHDDHTPLYGLAWKHKIL